MTYMYIKSIFKGCLSKLYFALSFNRVCCFRGCPVLVQLPHPAVQVAAGSHHTVVLLNNGQVYTFGNHQVI